MTSEPSDIQLSQALQRFRDAHMQAFLQDWVKRIRGESSELLSYDEVRKILQAHEVGARPKLEEVPLDKIVGSVGRYRDFNSAFLPKNEALEERWARVDAARETLTGLPPVDLLKVGDLYFVRDGNHRVSVARAHGEKTIEAYVTPVETALPIEAKTAEELRAWLIEASRLQFLRRTGLDKHVPDAPIRLTEPGRYRDLYEHIDVHRWYLGEARGEAIPYEEAALSWYENVYLPLARAIEESGLLKEFPGRTVTDLYLWLCKHREELRGRYDLVLDEEAAVATFASVYSGKPLKRALKRARLKLAQLAGGDHVILGLPSREKGEDEDDG
ncbi:MAG TPA: transcriptional regulator [Anaerolineae bacterium]|nr:transcriptional regulator [Caldilineae bacterium]HID34898.1 transcriptional regulator [Anaerolineae bacterium]HIQ11283.1 transcriptional regulator [Caldilineales bacterium]